MDCSKRHSEAIPLFVLAVLVCVESFEAASYSSWTASQAWLCLGRRGGMPWVLGS